MRFKDKVVVVTGAGRGIGKEIALSFAREGASLIINSMHAETIEPVAAEIIESHGAKVTSVVMDVSKEEDVEKLANAAFETYGRVDILVNNAGMNRDQFFVRMTAEDWDPVIDVNLRGTFLCMRHFTRKMVRQKYGRVINMASVAGEAGNIGQANYAAAKAGIIGLTKSAAKELARYGITVNAVSPGLIETDMISRMEGDVRENLKAIIPVGEFGTAGQVAAAVLFLASDDSAYITGQTLRVDGGLYI